MHFEKLVLLYESLEKTSKKLEKASLIAEFIKTLENQDLKHTIHLLQGHVFPFYAQEKIGFNANTMVKALQQAADVSKEEVIKKWKTLGDLGVVGEELLNKKKQLTLVSQELSLKKIYENIQKLATIEGKGTVNKKIDYVLELLNQASSKEAKYIIKIVLEALRIGVSEGIIRDAIAKAFEKESEDIEDAFNVLGDYAEVAKKAKENTLDKKTLTPGKPFKVMLAILIKDILQGFKQIGNPCQIEYKYDGMRLQIHVTKKGIFLFTRRLENLTTQFPDIVENIQEQHLDKEAIFDCEVVGYDHKTKAYLPFKNISQRIKRKYDIQEISKEFPVECILFDLVYYDNKTLLNEPFKKRIELLHQIIKPKERKVTFSKSMQTDDEKEAQRFYTKALQEGQEGLIFKNLDAPYKAGRYVGFMAKLKPTLEPLDLVIVKAEYGHGKRANWLSSFTVACKEKDTFLEVGKVSTGVKEKSKEGVSFKELTKLLKPLVTKSKGNTIEVKPQIILEVAYEEIQKSPTYDAKMALRFPRVIQLRNDKDVTEINTLQDIERIYHVQKGKKS